MTNWWQPGQLLHVGFHGTTVPGDLREHIASGRVGGVTLFARNIESPAQLSRLVADLHACAPSDLPLLLSIDQEGGRVQRLRDPWTVWPPMGQLGKLADTQAITAVATAIAQELRDVGVGLNFAPVVDVDTNPDNPVIGDRSFARDPALVANLASAFITAQQQAGVAACAKHFPGHGDTSLDSHLDLPRVDHGLDRLRRTELVPFAAAVAAEVASVMTAHILFPAIDAKRPATISPAVLGFLRGELGFDGVIFSDDLEMGAMAKHFGVQTRILGPLEAGVDGLLICSRADLREEALRLVERAPDNVVEQALTRMVALKRAYATASRLQQGHRAKGPPYPDHQQLATKLGS